MASPEETTRSRLLDAAEDLFAERGYDAVGIREIADRAGVNLSGIKYHFGSKRGLYLETIRRSMDERGSAAAWDLLREPIATRAEAAGALGAFIRAFLGVLLGPEESARCVCLVMQAALRAGDATDLVVREFVRPHHERLCDLIGVLCPGAGARERSRCAQSVMAQLLHQRMFKEFLDRLEPGRLAGDAAIERLAGEITDFSLRGMGCGDVVGHARDRAAAAAMGERA
jgi:TetR/AcrR family transcriptional regulator, regulator of cefoperazone and chloramphenicol sensitivity